MNESVVQQIQRYCDDSQLYKVHTVQKLWSDYGEIARYYSPKLANTVIVKQISVPTHVVHPRGWHSSVSHQRKLLSYQMEANFYQDFASDCNPQCKVADLIGSSASENTAVNTVNNTLQIMVLEDLDSSGFQQRCTIATLDEIKLGIRWLAYFHGRFLSVETPNLWPVGSYWHLATRPDEYRVMPPSELKNAAGAIDQCLNQASYQTLLHGDAKLANFCFAADVTDIAAVDFQYVGQGIGVKDLMYFLGSCLASQDLFAQQDSLLDYYFVQLRGAVDVYQIACDMDALEHQWRVLYPLVWADFNRFLQGWSPDHNKINPYMEQQTKLALSQL